MKVGDVGTNLTGFLSEGDPKPFLGDSHWTLDPGRVYGFVQPMNESEPISAGSPPPNSTLWPIDSPVAYATPSKYRCFQVMITVAVD